MIRPVWLALVLACAGCAETAAPLASAPAPRHAGAWQQFCEQAWNVQQASQLAAARGADGWELVAMYNGVLCFKRPSADAQHAPASPGAPASASTAAPFVPLVRDPGF